MNNGAHTIKLNNGNLYSVRWDPRVKKSHVEGGVLTVAARSKKAAQELASEARAWGADAYTSDRIVHVGN